MTNKAFFSAFESNRINVVDFRLQRDFYRKLTVPFSSSAVI